MIEKTLISNFLNNKQNAAKDLYDYLMPSVMRICIRYIGRNELCNDVFQEAFIKIFSSLNKYESKSLLKTWAISITINTAINYLKKENRMGFLIEFSSENLPEQADVDIERKIAIEPEIALEWVNELPENYKIVMNLFIDKKSHEEISELLGISTVSSRVTLNRARKILKTRLENYTNRNEKAK